MEPWGYSLRELDWRAKVIGLTEWDKVAWLVYHVPFTGGKGKWQDYNPLRQLEKQATKRRFSKDMDSARAHLPDTLTEDEIEELWQKHLKEQNNGNGR